MIFSKLNRVVQPPSQSSCKMFLSPQKEPSCPFAVTAPPYSQSKTAINLQKADVPFLDIYLNKS